MFTARVFNDRMLTPVELSAFGLTLRPWEEGDVAAALRGLSDPDFSRWNTPAEPVRDEAAALRFIRARAQGWRRGDMASYAVVADGEVRGYIGVAMPDARMRSGRIGYWTIREHRGHGLATRALETVSRWCFRDLRLHRLDLVHDVGNDASCAVARRCGYLCEGVLRGGRVDLTGVPRDMHLHARIASDRAPDPEAIWRAPREEARERTPRAEA
ncbi:putative acetyltransferase [Streptantibioticus cattleyicolor NRRL 8057 = DSM 46488]|nr:putative acetyltransferase [Streptantibioticus cattleyicolor NRRL 8057 = DSM 46488]